MYLLILLTLIFFELHSQQLVDSKKDNPVEIYAEDAIEWQAARMQTPVRVPSNQEQRMQWVVGRVAGELSESCQAQGSGSH